MDGGHQSRFPGYCITSVVVDVERLQIHHQQNGCPIRKAPHDTSWTTMTGVNRHGPAQISQTVAHPQAVAFETHPQGTAHSRQRSSASSYADLKYSFGIQDQAMLAPKADKGRRKSTHGSDHAKHRRTRSGCYTCRSRRVKVCM